MGKTETGNPSLGPEDQQEGQGKDGPEEEGEQQGQARDPRPPFGLDEHPEQTCGHEDGMEPDREKGCQAGTIGCAEKAHFQEARPPLFLR